MSIITKRLFFYRIAKSTSQKLKSTELSATAQEIKAEKIMHKQMKQKGPLSQFVFICPQSYSSFQDISNNQDHHFYRLKFIKNEALAKLQITGIVGRQSKIFMLKSQNLVQSNLTYSPSLDVCHVYLTEAFLAKMEKNQKKYPSELVKEVHRVQTQKGNQ